MLIEEIVALQKLVFQENCERKKLLEYVPTCKANYCVQVIRNHSFELVEHTIGAFLDYAGIGVDFTYTSYDDSFSFGEVNPNVDLYLIWIDASRYQNTDIKTFLGARVDALRRIAQHPILIVPLGCDVDVVRGDVCTFCLSNLAEKMGAAFTDERMSKFTGTRLSNEAMVNISRELGLRYLPAMLKPALKAIIVDLDNTLYQGIIGEDGIENVVLTPGHRQLQQTLAKLSTQGFFLCAVSKNEQVEAERVFEIRKDFPLKKAHFTRICASWDQKTKSISDLAKFLNISADSMVFIDDNIGELAAVHAVLPQVRLLCAMPDGEETARAVANYPGLMKVVVNREDALRRDDAQANEKRRALQATLNNQQYIESLKMHLTYSYNNPEHIQRVSELANKTNQFIFNYKRYSQTDVEERVFSENYQVVTISLSDCLSDSGLIGVCVGRKVSDYVELEECFISCRALGRGIDDLIVLGAIHGILQHFQCEKLKVLFREGPRNTPAHMFFNQYLSGYETPAIFNKYRASQTAVSIENVDYQEER